MELINVSSTILVKLMGEKKDLLRRFILVQMTVPEIKAFTLSKLKFLKDSSSTLEHMQNQILKNNNFSDSSLLGDYNSKMTVKLNTSKDKLGSDYQ